MHTRSLVVLAALLVLASDFRVSHAQEAEEEIVLTRFQQAVDGYVSLKAEATDGRQAPEISLGMGNIRRAIAARHDAIAAARSGARQGDVFSNEVKRIVRARIHEVLSLHGLNDIQALAIVDDEVSGPVPMIIVNGFFPWDYGSAMLPCVIGALPPLPRGLQFRFVHTSLVLLDVEADLIVDILPHALLEGLYA